MVPIKVILADENEIFREGLARLLEDQDEIEVVSLCSNGKQVIDRVRETRPDVVLMDSSMPERDSIDITGEIRKSLPEVKVAMFTHSEDHDRFCAAIESGAAGYLSKDMKVNDLVKSIDLIEKGQVVVSPPLAAKLGRVASLRTETDAARTSLSERELEVLKLVARGDTNREIAGELFLAENTVRVHVKNILEKLGLRNRQQAAAYAAQQGLTSDKA
ncbi:MAG: response regulator transcription factor [Chloroflexi bacterium]|nr:response regulator transcription factor [Chloroflexota bacterium]